MANLTLLCGLPACGKSTWRNKNVTENDVVISSDDLIEEEAKKLGKTYDEVFQENIKWADKAAKIHFEMAIRKGEEIIVDRTNLTPKVRKYWIELAKSYGYTVKVIWFEAPDTVEEIKEWERRLLSREGKQIPANILVSMIANKRTPTLEEENVDSISYYDSFDSNLETVA